MANQNSIRLFTLIIGMIFICPIVSHSSNMLGDGTVCNINDETTEVDLYNIINEPEDSIIQETTVSNLAEEEQQQIDEKQALIDSLMKENAKLKEANSQLSDWKGDENESNDMNDHSGKSALSKLKKTSDEISGIIWYQNPVGFFSSPEFLNIYIVQTDTKLKIRLRARYKDYNWIFFNTVILYYDGNIIEVPFSSSEKDEEVVQDKGVKVVEKIDVEISDDIIDFLRGMVKGKDVKVRFTGKTRVTKKVSKGVREKIEDVLLAYDELMEDFY